MTFKTTPLGLLILLLIPWIATCDAPSDAVQYTTPDEHAVLKHYPDHIVPYDVETGRVTPAIIAHPEVVIVVLPMPDLDRWALTVAGYERPWSRVVLDDSLTIADIQAVDGIMGPDETAHIAVRTRSGKIIHYTWRLDEEPQRDEVPLDELAGDLPSWETADIGTYGLIRDVSLAVSEAGALVIGFAKRVDARHAETWAAIRRPGEDWAVSQVASPPPEADRHPNDTSGARTVAGFAADERAIVGVVYGDPSACEACSQSVTFFMQRTSGRDAEPDGWVHTGITKTGVPANTTADFGGFRRWIVSDIFRASDGAVWLSPSGLGGGQGGASEHEFTLLVTEGAEPNPERTLGALRGTGTAKDESLIDGRLYEGSDGVTDLSWRLPLNDTEADTWPMAPIRYLSSPENPGHILRRDVRPPNGVWAHGEHAAYRIGVVDGTVLVGHLHEVAENDTATGYRLPEYTGAETYPQPVEITPEPGSEVSLSELSPLTITMDQPWHVPQFNCYNVGPFYDGDEIVDDASLKFARFVQQDHRGEVTPCEGRIGGGCYRKTQVFECELRDSGQGETLPCFNFPHHDVICPIRPIGLKQTSDRTRTYNYGVNGIEPVRLKYTSTDEPEPLEPDTTLEWSGACSGDAYTRCGCQRKAGGSYSLRFGQSDRTLGLAAVASLPEPLAHLEYTDGTAVPSVTVTPEGQLDAPTATGGAVAMGLTLTWNQELRANSTVEVVVSPEVRDFFNGHQIGVAPEESTFETFDPNLNVVGSEPADGATGVALDAHIDVHLSRDINAALSDPIAAVSVDTAAGTPVDGTILQPDASTIRVVPQEALQPQTTYRVTVRGGDYLRTSVDCDVLLRDDVTIEFTTGSS